jgi:hypothetical protein
MGWKEGEGLGKKKEGVLNPLALDIKTDRKGLVSYDEPKPGKSLDASKMAGENQQLEHKILKNSISILVFCFYRR